MSNLEKEIGKEITTWLGEGTLVAIGLLPLPYYAIFRYMWNKYYENQNILGLKRDEIADEIAILEARKEKSMRNIEKINAEIKKLETEKQKAMNNIRKADIEQRIRIKKFDANNLEKDYWEASEKYEFLIHVEWIIKNQKELKENGFWDNLAKKSSKKFDEKLKEMMLKQETTNEKINEIKRIIENAERFMLIPPQQPKEVKETIQPTKLEKLNYCTNKFNEETIKQLGNIFKEEGIFILSSIIEKDKYISTPKIIYEKIEFDRGSILTAIDDYVKNRKEEKTIVFCHGIDLLSDLPQFLKEIHAFKDKSSYKNSRIILFIDKKKEEEIQMFLANLNINKIDFGGD